ncbi:unnamed protein product [Rotaria socialis]|nr:unnamed protein product [Rotaria socialis]
MTMISVIIWALVGGEANGYNGQSFYIIIKCIDNWPAEYRTEAGQERAHDYLLKSVMGRDYDQTRIACGGFFYIHGELKCNSTWLNTRNQQGARSDGRKTLSDDERALVTYCFDQYKRSGKHQIFEMSSALDQAFSTVTQPSDAIVGVLVFEQKYV